MSEKEEIKRLKELKDKLNANKKVMEGGHTKSIGGHPTTKGFFKETKKNEKANGYSNALLLGFIVFIYQIILLGIMYIFIS